jgi:hypothetical protein
MEVYTLKEATLTFDQSGENSTWQVTVYPKSIYFYDNGEDIMIPDGHKPGGSSLLLPNLSSTTIRALLATDTVLQDGAGTESVYDTLVGPV